MLNAIVMLAVLGAPNCGEIRQYAIGGDYTSAKDRRNLALVEAFHFTPDIEALRHTAIRPGENIATTLEHYPNHHRALAAMARLGQREAAAKVNGAAYTVDCYFERAMRYRPADAKVRVVFSSHLLETGRADAALAQMREAVRIDPLDAASHYNLGILLVMRGDYAQAKAHARVAYERGFPLPALKNKLLEAGHWKGGD